jgi:hypothetical protein
MVSDRRENADLRVIRHGAVAMTGDDTTASGPALTDEIAVYRVS